MILDNSRREMISQEVFSSIIFVRFVPQHTHKVIFRSDIFRPDYCHIWNSKVKIWVWARLEKRDDLNVSTSQWSPDVSQCLRNNWVTRRRHTLVYFTAQTPLRMQKTPPDITLAGGGEQPETSSRLLSLHWTLLDRAALLTKIVADMHQDITNHQADLNMVMMVPQICNSH